MNELEDIVFRLASVTPEPEDYTGEDGLLYCGKCRTAKQFRMEGEGHFAGKLFPHRCKCEQERFDREEADRERRRHNEAVDRLKRACFDEPEMRGWCFENDNGHTPQMGFARRYVESWDEVKKNNLGLLLWGDTDSGKSFLAGCIANALMEREIAVRMTNFAAVLNDLAASFEGRNEYISRLCRYPLLILDDLGAERDTEYGLEQVYNVIDSRYRSGRPLILTTNLTISAIKEPPDTAHKRIYSRIEAMCAAVLCTGRQNRREQGKEKMKLLQGLMSR